jgi:hypothetical protein
VDSTEDSGVGGGERKSYLIDIYTYAHTIHIKHQVKEAINWNVLYLLQILHKIYIALAVQIKRSLAQQGLD